MRKNIAMGAALSVAALGLVGVGAGATFTDSVTATQRIQTGTLDLQIGVTGGALGDSVTLPTALDQGSKGSVQQQITVKNAGSLAAEVVKLEVTGGVDDAINPANFTVSAPGFGSVNLAELRSDSPIVFPQNLALQPGQAPSVTLTISWDGLTNGEMGKALTTVFKATAEDATAD